MRLAKPYWFERDSLPGNDFNREIVEPGTSETFPDGCVGIRVDDDFWAVAALPLEQYREKSVEAIVAELWPHMVDGAAYAPDHGTVEMEVYRWQQEAQSAKKAMRKAWEKVSELTDQVARLEAEHPDISDRALSRKRKRDEYFIRQYETLLRAVAHGPEPIEDKPGLCRRCGLLISDRVHSARYINGAPDPHWAHAHFDEEYQ